jgi:predicted GNAT family N-acyltransferase
MDGGMEADMLIQGKFLVYGDDLTEALQIRRKVFVEEQGIPEAIEFDGLDVQAIHVLVWEEAPPGRDKESGKPDRRAVATGRITYDGAVCRIGHIAVLRECRGMGYGDFTVKMLLNKAFTSGIGKVLLDAQALAVGFYQKIGFQSTGQHVSDMGIKYWEMVIYAQDIVKKCDKNGKR